MARIEPLSTEESPDRLGNEVDHIERERGSPLNNCFKKMARRPDILRPFLDLTTAVMHKPSEVPKALKWMAAHVASNASGCRYCTAHTARHSAARGEVSQEKLEAIWVCRTSANFSAAERAALELALAAGSAPAAVTDGHFVELRRHFTDDKIVEIIASLRCSAGLTAGTILC